MKSILLTLLAPMLAMVVRKNTTWIDALDFTSLRYDITWDDITDDLWP